MTEIHYRQGPVAQFKVVKVAQWLTCCATNRKDAGSIPAGVVIFH